MSRNRKRTRTIRMELHPTPEQARMLEEMADETGTIRLVAEDAGGPSPEELAAHFADLVRAHVLWTEDDPTPESELDDAVRMLMEMTGWAGPDVCRAAVGVARERERKAGRRERRLRRRGDRTGEELAHIDRRAYADAAPQLERCALLLRGEVQPVDHLERLMLRAAGLGRPGPLRSWIDRFRSFGRRLRPAGADRIPMRKNDRGERR